MTRRIDWLRIAHRVTTLVRDLRGDDQLDDDHRMERGRATTMRGAVDELARTVMGCQKPNPCDCPICSEEEDP